MKNKIISLVLILILLFSTCGHLIENVYATSEGGPAAHPDTGAEETEAQTEKLVSQVLIVGKNAEAISSNFKKIGTNESYRCEVKGIEAYNEQYDSIRSYSEFKDSKKYDYVFIVPGVVPKATDTNKYEMVDNKVIQEDQKIFEDKNIYSQSFVVTPVYSEKGVENITASLDFLSSINKFKELNSDKKVEFYTELTENTNNMSLTNAGSLLYAAGMYARILKDTSVAKYESANDVFSNYNSKTHDGLSDEEYKAILDSVAISFGLVTEQTSKADNTNTNTANNTNTNTANNTNTNTANNTNTNTNTNTTPDTPEEPDDDGDLSDVLYSSKVVFSPEMSLSLTDRDKVTVYVYDFNSRDNSKDYGMAKEDEEKDNYLKTEDNAKKDAITRKYVESSQSPNESDLIRDHGAFYKYTIDSSKFEKFDKGIVFEVSGKNKAGNMYHEKFKITKRTEKKDNKWYRLSRAPRVITKLIGNNSESEFSTRFELTDYTGLRDSDKNGTLVVSTVPVTTNGTSTTIKNIILKDLTNLKYSDKDKKIAYYGETKNTQIDTFFGGKGKIEKNNGKYDYYFSLSSFDKANFDADRQIKFVDVGEVPNDDGGNNEGNLKIKYPDSNKVYMYKQINSYPKLSLGSTDDASRFMIKFSDGSGIDKNSFKLYYGTSNKGVELKSGDDYNLDYNKDEGTLYVAIKRSKKNSYEISSSKMTYFYAEVNDASEDKLYYKGDFSISLDGKGNVIINKAPDNVYPVTIKNDKGKYESKNIAFRCNDSTGIAALWLRKANGNDALGSKGSTGWLGTKDDDWRDIISITGDKKNVKEGITTFEKLEDIKSAKIDKHIYKVALKTKDKNGIYSIVSTKIDTSYVKKAEDSSAKWEKIVSDSDADPSDPSDPSNPSNPSNPSSPDNDQSGSGTGDQTDPTPGPSDDDDGGGYTTDPNCTHPENKRVTKLEKRYYNTDMTYFVVERCGLCGKEMSSHVATTADRDICTHPDTKVEFTRKYWGSELSFLRIETCNICGKELSCREATSADQGECTHPLTREEVGMLYNGSTPEHYMITRCEFCGKILSYRPLKKDECPKCKGGDVTPNDIDSWDEYVPTGNECEYKRIWHCNICGNSSEESDLYYKHEAPTTRTYKWKWKYRLFTVIEEKEHGSGALHQSIVTDDKDGTPGQCSINYCAHCKYTLDNVSNGLQSIGVMSAHPYDAGPYDVNSNTQYVGSTLQTITKKKKDLKSYFKYDFKDNSFNYGSDYKKGRSTVTFDTIDNLIQGTLKTKQYSK